MQQKSRFQGRWFVALVLAGAVVLLSRCGMNLNSPASGTFSHVYQNTLGSASCIQCHQPGGAGNADGATLDFTTQAKAYSTLVGTTASPAKVQSTDHSSCATVKLVNSGSPTTSYVMAELFSSLSSSNFAGVSGCTPYAGHSLNISSAEQTSITTWITNGAANN